MYKRQNNSSGADVIQLGSGVHTLSMSGFGDELGDLDLTDEVEIIGAADGSSEIDATGLGDRVFDVTSDATLKNLTITGGDETAAGNNGGGGGIRTGGSANVIVDNIVVTDNHSDGRGGGIHNEGFLTVTNSTISSNTGEDGGGISSVNTLTGIALTVTNSTVSGNTASFDGGGISSTNGQILLDSVTISGNAATDDGGGIHIVNDDSHELINVTVSGNSTDDRGGGIFVNNARVNIDNATIYDNTANPAAGGTGGGLSVLSIAVNVTESIISGNNASFFQNALGATSITDSIIGNVPGLMLGPLANNGDVVQTHALLPGSDGINGGSAAVAGETDGRGFLVADSTRDIGAFEFGATQPPGSLVDLSSGIELNTDGGNNTYLISDTGLATSLSATTFEIQFVASNEPAELVLVSFNNAAGDEFTIQTSNAGGLIIDIGDGSSEVSTAVDYRTLLQDGELHSLAVTWDSSNGEWIIYLDGQFVDSGMGLNTGVALDTTNGQFVFGQEQDGLATGFSPDQRFSGTIYDVRIWDEVRSATEIAENFQQKISPASLPAELVANWQFDGFDTNNQVVDVVSLNNLTIEHATGTGFIAGLPADDLTVAENSSNGTSIGFVIATGGDAATISYSLTNDANGRFEIDSATGEITVLNGVLLNHEANQTHVVTVTVSDSTSTHTEDFTITVGNVNEAPSFDTEQPPTFTEHAIPAASSNRFSVETVDLDGDSDLDLAVADSTSDEIFWYENDGNGNFTEHSVASNVDARSVVVTDVDNDGDLDLVSASGSDDTIAWYENDGNQNFMRHVIANDADGAFDVTTADVDGDGDIDVLSASQIDDRIVWYENNGSEAFTTQVISSSLDGAFTIDTADIDGDGDLDVVAGGINANRVVWYENDGTQGFTENDVTSSVFNDVRSIVAADIDGDGDVDVAGVAFGGDEVAWFENNGNGAFSRQAITTDADGATDVEVADVDGDGDLDVLATIANDNEVVWYENNGTQSFTAHTISSTADGARAIATGDLNGDGRLDVIATTSSFGGSGELLWYENDGFLFTNTLDGNPTFMEDGMSVVLDSDVAIFDPELSVLNGGSDDFGGTTLTIERSGGANSDDVFSAGGMLSFGATDFSLAGTTVGTFTNSAGRIELTFDAGVTNDEVNQVMRSLQYSNSSDAPPASVSLAWTFDDNNNGSQGSGGALQANGLTTVNITSANDAPTLSNIEGGAVSFTEGGAPVGITASLSLDDLDDINIESAVVSISNNFAAGEDELIFTDQSGITGSFNAATGTLTLTGSASVTDYQAALTTVVYNNTSDNPSVLTRTVSFEINDGDLNSNIVNRDIDFTAVNDAPVLSGIETAPASYTENDAPLVITGSTAVSDVDDTNIESAVVSISSNFSADDVLGFTDQNGISGNYNAANGILSLTGSASLADYQTALQSITYENTSDDPSDLTRTVTFQINDGDVDSNIVSRDIDFTAVNDAPTLANIEAVPASYTEGGSAVGITANLSLADLDDTNIESAVVSISNNFAAGEDELIFTDQSGISGSFDAATGTLTLTGSASVADYQAALTTITYNNTSVNPSTLTRTVSFEINDGDLNSNCLLYTSPSPRD